MLIQLILFPGLEDISGALKEINSGIPLDKPLPSLSGLIKKTQSSFEAEISALGPHKDKSSSTYGFFILAKAIGVCLDEKKRVDEKKNNFQNFLENWFQLKSFDSQQCLDCNIRLLLHFKLSCFTWVEISLLYDYSILSFLHFIVYKLLLEASLFDFEKYKLISNLTNFYLKFESKVPLEIYIIKSWSLEISQ